MGKKAWGQSSNISLQSVNSGCINKLRNALDRRHRWQNVRKGLPNKPQGSGKQIIDGGSSEDTTQPPEVPRDPKRNKQPKNEQEITTETRSKKFRIRSLISDEMAKRRGKQHWRRSSSPTRSPKKKTSSFKKTDSYLENKCQSPSTTKKKRKCNICAAMLTVSYLRQKGLAKERMAIENEKKQAADRRTAGLTKSFSFPLHAVSSNKKRDSELQQLKDKLRDLKDIQTTKDKFILPMNQLKDVGVPKPMLTRPESFRSTSTSLQEKKQTTNQSKTLKQKIGFVVKVDSRKEKRRILMDAVFHKIPYGRKSSKDPKKVGPDKLKTTTSTPTGADKTSLRKTSSTSEVMSKYRKLLSQRSTRDEKLQHSSDNKPKLFVASSEKKRHKRMRSLPSISPYDFMPQNQEFPVKPTIDVHLSISSEIFDDFELYPEKRKVPQSIGKAETKLINKKEEVVDEHLKMDSNHQEENNHQNESEAAASATETGSTENDDQAFQESIYDHQEQNDHQQQVVDDDPGIGQDSSTDHDINSDNQKEEPRVAIEVKNDKSFDEILGMFKKVSDERTKLNNENESSGIARKVAKNTSVADKHKSDYDLNKDQDVQNDLQVSQNTMDHQDKDNAGSDHSTSDQDVSQKTSDHDLEYMSPLSSSYDVDKDHIFFRNTLDHQESPLTSCSEAELPMQDSSSLIDITNIQLTDENKRYMFSINDDDEKRLKNNEQGKHKSVAGACDRMIKNRFLHLDLESVKDNAEFQFVKQVLEKSGFLKDELVLGEWYSKYQPIDPLLFEEVETSFLQTKLLEELDSMKDEEVVQKIINDHHLLLFDLVNEALLEIHSKTYTYCPHPLTYRSKVSPMPVGCRLLEEVWDIVSMYMSWKPEMQVSLDDAVSRDLAKGSGWMNLQGDAELVGIELEDLLVDDLLDELVFDDLLM